jgi:hypothetical protein
MMHRLASASSDLYESIFKTFSHKVASKHDHFPLKICVTRDQEVLRVEFYSQMLLGLGESEQTLRTADKPKVCRR